MSSPFTDEEKEAGAAKHVAQNHLGAAFGLEVRGR